MPTIGAGSLTGFFLYDVAEAIDLDAIGRLISATTPARMTPKAPGPAYIQYAHPPVSVDGHAVGLPTLDAWQVRFKLFDYGVISIALTQPTPGTWDGLLGEALRWHEDPTLPAGVERLCRAVVDRLRPALAKPRTELLSGGLSRLQRLAPRRR
jgi:hypothetical protein